MPITPAKSVLVSKTFWVNAAALLTWLAAQSWVVENPKLVQFAGIALAVTNIALRFVTDRPVKLPGA